MIIFHATPNVLPAWVGIVRKMLFPALSWHITVIVTIVEQMVCLLTLPTYRRG